MVSGYLAAEQDLRWIAAGADIGTLSHTDQLAARRYRANGVADA